jgi:hypothetical protein
MKKLTLLLLVVVSTFGYSQDKETPEFTGDNFSLEGALVMFKKSNSLEEFEKYLNQEENNVNNLDLNNDGNIDYINVDDLAENNTHVIVLSTYLSENEKQDIATINIEKTGNETASLQIEGDQELYAENTIVEPFDIDEKAEKSSGGGPSVPEIITTNIVVNVWGWSCVRYIYAPTYVVFVSPHRWGFYPKWYRPWRPFHHSFFISRCAPHKIYFRHSNFRRAVIARKIYGSRRRSSNFIIHKNHRGNKTIMINKRGGRVRRR